MQKNTFTKITLENAMSFSRNSSNLPSGLTSQEHFSILEPYISKSVTVNAPEIFSQSLLLYSNARTLQHISDCSPLLIASSSIF